MLSGDVSCFRERAEQSKASVRKLEVLSGSPIAFASPRMKLSAERSFGPFEFCFGAMDKVDYVSERLKGLVGAHAQSSVPVSKLIEATLNIMNPAAWNTAVSDLPIIEPSVTSKQDPIPATPPMCFVAEVRIFTCAFSSKTCVPLKNDSAEQHDIEKIECSASRQLARASMALKGLRIGLQDTLAHKHRRDSRSSNVRCKLCKRAKPEFRESYYAQVGRQRSVFAFCSESTLQVFLHIEDAYKS